MYQKESKQSARKDPVFKTKERESKQSARKDSVFKTKERESKQFLEKIVFSRLSKLCIKRNQSREQGKIRLLKSKKKNVRISQKKAMENPYVLEYQRIKKQQIRQEKRKINDDLEITVPRKNLI